MTTTFYNGQESLETKDLVKQQIMDLGSALFFTENESLLRLPVHVINSVQIDEEYNIWFLIQRPTQALTEFDAQLPAKLDFFKKGMPYTVKVTGTAFIVDNTEKINELAGEGYHDNLVAIRIMIRTTELTGNAPKAAQGSWFEQSKKQLSSLFSLF